MPPEVFPAELCLSMPLAVELTAILLDHDLAMLLPTAEDTASDMARSAENDWTFNCALERQAEPTAQTGLWFRLPIQHGDFGARQPASLAFGRHIPHERTLCA